MNRNDLQKLSRLRIQEARSLFRARHFSGAYYLTGYAVECGLKACIAKQNQKFDFPDKSKVDKSYTHDLKVLLKLADLLVSFDLAIQTNPDLGASWNVVDNWDEKSRYSVWNKDDADAIIKAVGNRKSGVLTWIKQYW